MSRLLQACLALLICILFAAPALAETRIGMFDVSKTPWGQSRDETRKAYGLEINASDDPNAPFLLTGFTVDKYQATRSFFFENGRLAAIIVLVGPEENPGFTEADIAPLKDTLSAANTQLYGAPLPNIPAPAWKTKDHNYIVLNIEFDGTGKALACRLLPEATFETLFPGAQVYAPALKGKDTEFEARVRERLAATGIEPRGDFEMIKTEAAHDVYAAYRLRQTPLLLDAAKDEARDVLVVMIKELVALGINPGAENMMVSLRLYEPEEGLTGQNMQRVYGRWRYNPGTDSAEWLPAGE